MSGNDYLNPAHGAGFWIGHPGALYHVHGVVSPFDVEDKIEPVLSTSLGGGVRAREQRIRAPRQWGIDIPDVYPQDVSNLRTLLAGTMGPYVFVDPWSQKTNLLTPEESVLGSVTTPSEGLARGGGWKLIGTDNQWTPITRSNPSGGVVEVGTAPVPPAWAPRTVTASCWVASTVDVALRLDWLDGSGNRITPSVFAPQVTGMDGLRRSVASGTPPWGAVSVQIFTIGAEVLANAAVTWTDEPTAWDVGNGVHRVVVSGLGRSFKTASNVQRLHDLSFTVHEVGPAQVKS